MSDAPQTGEALPDFLQTTAHCVSVEITMDSHRIVGELRPTGAPRRLVDTLNSIESGFVLVHDGKLDDPCNANEEPRAFDVLHIHRDAILFAAPRGGSLDRGTPFDSVQKVAVPATIVLPGFELSGNVFLLPGVHPAEVTLLASRHFIPLTDVTIVAGHGQTREWQEPVLIINLARALSYAPKTPA